MIEDPALDDMWEAASLDEEYMTVARTVRMCIRLMDQTILVPEAMRKRLMDREHLAHPGINKMLASLRAKYLWPGIEKNVRRVVEGCEPCQVHMNSQTRDPHRLTLEYVSQPM